MKLDVLDVREDSKVLGLLWWQGESAVPGARADYETFRKLYRDGALDNRKIQLDIPDGRSRLPLEIGGVSGFGVNELIFRVYVCPKYTLIVCLFEFMCGCQLYEVLGMN